MGCAIACTLRAGLVVGRERGTSSGAAAGAERSSAASIAASVSSSGAHDVDVDAHRQPADHVGNPLPRRHVHCTAASRVGCEADVRYARRPRHRQTGVDKRP